MASRDKGKPYHLALQLHKVWRVRVFPFDPRPYLPQLGIELREDSFTTTSFDGCLFRVGQKGTILLNANVPYESRKTFTVAHELGHFLLHEEPMFQCSLGNMNGFYGSSLESEANSFASELLMPSAVFAQKAVSMPTCLETCESLANEFGTSLTSTAFKFVNTTEDPCVLVISQNGRVIRFASSRNFKFSLRRPVSPSCETITIVPGHKWLTDARSTTQLIEENRPFSKLGMVMSLLQLTDFDDSPYDYSPW